MNRQDFIKRIGLGTLVAFFTPKILLAEINKEPKPFVVIQHIPSGKTENHEPFMFFVECSLQNSTHIYALPIPFHSDKIVIDKEIELIRIEVIKGNYYGFSPFIINGKPIVPQVYINGPHPKIIFDLQYPTEVIKNYKDIAFPNFKDGIIKVTLFPKKIHLLHNLYQDFETNVYNGGNETISVKLGIPNI